MPDLQQKRIMRGVAALALLVSGVLPQSLMAATVTQPDDKSSATIVIPVTLINIQATCDVTFSGSSVSLGSHGGTYPLGALSRGEEKKHTPFTAVIECQDMDGTETVSTALTASARTGTLSGSNDSIRMLVDDEDNGNAPVLWLETGAGQRVPLDGSTPFCVGNGLNRNECALTPHTQVPDNSPGGEVSATVVFDVTYV